MSTRKNKQTILEASCLFAACAIGSPTKASGKVEDRAALAAGAQAIRKAKGEKPNETAAPVEVPAPKLTKLKFVTETVKLGDLVFSSKIQPRETLNKEALNDYTAKATEAKEKGADSPFPPLKAVRRNGEVIVFSGFHRGNALKKAEYTETKVEIADSDNISDAELFRLAIEANKEHGARLTNADKLHNLNRALKYPEFAGVSNNALVDIVGASEFFIRTHRPANKSGAVRTSKTGKTINTSRIGKKGGKKPAKPGKKAAAAAANLAANAPAGGSATNPQLPGDEAANPLKLDGITLAKLERIKSLLDGHNGLTASGIQTALEQGTLKLSPGDIRAFAESSDARVRQIAPLVINHGWTPKKAYAHIDKTVDGSTKVEHLVNTALTTGGSLKNGSLDGEAIEDNPNFRVLVWDTTKFNVTVTAK